MRREPPYAPGDHVRRTGITYDNEGMYQGEEYVISTCDHRGNLKVRGINRWYHGQPLREHPEGERMNMQFIRDRYRVPAKRGKRIAFTCCDTCGLRLGTIVASEGKYLRVRFDEDHGAGRPVSIHPTWNVDYLDQK